MARIKFRKGLQRKFLNETKNTLKINWTTLANALKVSPRSLVDWRREKYTLPEKVFKRCLILNEKKVKVLSYQILPDYWYTRKGARKGALSRNKKYGNPRTKEGRRKGGLVSQQRRKLYPQLYRHCNLRKNVLKPGESSELAEFFGIVLGDGQITDNQVIISLNRQDDEKYLPFLQSLVKKLFGILPSVYYFHSPSHKNEISFTLSSKDLVEFLLSEGLKKGNKVKQQVRVPIWIQERLEFSKSCLRGLIDTDGSVYYHRHFSHNCFCFNIGLQFSNRSIPLLNFVKSTLEKLNFSPKRGRYSINLYSQSEILRYAKIVKFHNPYRIQRLEEFLRKKKYGGVA